MSNLNNQVAAKKKTTVHSVVVHFSGDSGDGMQTVGSQFTHASAVLGNDIQTFPDFPAEIRAPAGTQAGVSGFQLKFSDNEIHTAGDSIDTLIAMNPAALKVSIHDVKRGGLVIYDTDKFTEKDFEKAGLVGETIESLLNKVRSLAVPLTQLTVEAVAECDLSRSKQRKCKNMFALGIVSWIYQRPLETVKVWIQAKFKQSPDLLEANLCALQAGYNYADTLELLDEQVIVEPAIMPKGVYRQINGNLAVSLGCVASSILAKTPMLVAGYPITPASDIFQGLTRYQHFDVKTFQAEDEIASMGAILGAAFGGTLGVACTSGPGLDLKGEALGLAVMAELPMVVVNVQRAGPSTGMPTKVEQSDLWASVFGRHGECPLPVLALAKPTDGFEMMIEAFRIAIEFMTPVIVLSDANVANGSEPWQIPDIDSLPNLEPKFLHDPKNFKPYARNPETQVRPWVKPGTKDLMHCIGGLEKTEKGVVSSSPDNHQQMVNRRAEKIQNIAKTYPPTQVLGDASNELLVIGWGGTYGALVTAVTELQAAGYSVNFVHLRYIFPLPNDLESILANYKKIIVAELNSGQLCQMLRAKYLVDAKSISKISGQPFSVGELKDKILEVANNG